MTQAPDFFFNRNSSSVVCFVGYSPPSGGRTDYVDHEHIFRVGLNLGIPLSKTKKDNPPSILKLTTPTPSLSIILISCINQGCQVGLTLFVPVTV